MLWSKGFVGTHSSYASSLQQTIDSGFVIIGLIYLTGKAADIYLIKTDKNGSLQWSKTYGGSSDDFGNSLKQTIDNGYIISGYTKSFGAGGIDIYLIKTDSIGNHEWSKTFGTIDNESASSVQQTNDGGFIIAGNFNEFGTGKQDIYLIKTDSIGNLQWAKIYGGTFDDWCNSVLQDRDIGYVIIGNTRSFNIHSCNGANSFLLKTDFNGNLLWSKTYGEVVEQDGWYVGNSIQSTINNGFIICGSTGSNVSLINIDNNGNLMWSKKIGGSKYDYGSYAYPTNDKGFVITGYTYTFGGIYLIKTDPVGNSNCFDSESATIQNKATTLQRNIVTITNTPLTQFNIPSISVSNRTITETTLCSTTSVKKITKDNWISIYPNPFTLQTTINTGNYLNNATLTLYNLQGLTIKQIKNISGQSFTVFRDNLPGGLYFLRLTQDNKVITADKLVITD